MPLFISRQRLAGLKKLPLAKGPWSLDSGGFSQLSLHGEWTITLKQYVEEVRRLVECVGNMQWAASVDYMCEPTILAKTGLTVEEHQRRTLQNYRELMQMAPDLPWAPVLQGWSIGQYWDHATAYQKAGIDLAKAPVVGVGTLCRRQSTMRATALLATLHAEGLRLHGFGWKLKGLGASKDFLVSADSLAWSLRARRGKPLPECDHGSCQNCLRYALRWRAKLLRLLGKQDDMKEPPVQPTLF